MVFWRSWNFSFPHSNLHLLSVFFCIVSCYSVFIFCISIFFSIVDFVTLYVIDDALLPFLCFVLIYTFSFILSERRSGGVNEGLTQIHLNILLFYVIFLSFFHYHKFIECTKISLRRILKFSPKMKLYLSKLKLEFNSFQFRRKNHLHILLAVSG